MTTRKPRISRQVRDRVATESLYRCGYCRTPQSIAGYRLTIDHIIPEARGGTSVEENLWLACAACNQFKGVQPQARDPRTLRQVRLFNPRQQEMGNAFSLGPGDRLGPSGDLGAGDGHLRLDRVRARNSSCPSNEPPRDRGSSFSVGASGLVAAGGLIERRARDR